MCQTVLKELYTLIHLLQQSHRVKMIIISTFTDEDMQADMLSNLPKVTKLVEPGFNPRHGKSRSSGIRPGVGMSSV